MYLSLPIILSFQDYPEPDKHAALVYFKGCDRLCPGCHNTDLRAQKGGDYHTPAQLDQVLQERCKRWHTSSVVFTGGDPLMCRQLPSLKQFLTTYGHKYNICIYTGASKKEIVDKMGDTPNVNYYKGGMFDEALKVEPIGKTDPSMQLASTNQFILNSKFETLTTKGKILFNQVYQYG